MVDARLALVAAVSDDAVLEANLLRSPMVEDGAMLVLQRGYPCASRAYNAAFDAIGAERLVFVHQDMYLPPGWDERLTAGLDALESEGRDWAVAGIFGLDADGRFAGRIWSTGLGEIGTSPAAPVPAVSLDEIVLVVRRGSGVRFDDDLPGYHLYGTDVVQTARTAGHEAFVLDVPAVHNTMPVHYLDGGYRAAYRHMQRKWREVLPLATSVMPVTRSGLPLARYWLAVSRGRLGGRMPERRRHPAPVELARELGYETPAGSGRRLAAAGRGT